MVTLDKILKDVGTFEGSVRKERKKYETALQGIELAEEEIPKFEELLEAQTGYDDVNLPQGVQTTPITQGDITFKINSYESTKRPSYKGAVESVQTILRGFTILAPFMPQEMQDSFRIKKHQKTYFMEAQLMHILFDIIAEGYTHPGTTHTISYEVPQDHTIDEIVNLQKKDGWGMTKKDFQDYISTKHILSNLKKYAADYEKKLGTRKRKTSKVNTRVAAKKSGGTASGPDWTYVMKTLIQVRDEEPLGELDIIVDPDVPFTKKREMFPYYDLVRYKPKLEEASSSQHVYLSLIRVIDRIERLKNKKAILSNRAKIDLIEIV
jgi:hypothetical protein